MPTSWTSDAPVNQLSLDSSCIDWKGLEVFLHERNALATTLSDAYKRCFANAAGRGSMILITGPAGAGKTSFALSLQHQVAEDNGFMIYGKFDQFEYNLQTATTNAYSAFTEAFTHFVELCIAEESTLQSVKEALETDMDLAELQVLQEMLPALDKILGDKILGNRRQQSASIAGTSLLRGADADDRFVQIFTLFARTICSLGIPIVIFLDDVQWANPNELNLLANLLLPEDDGSSKPSGMLLCTCRTNMAGEQLVSNMLRDVKDQGVDVTEIQVSNMEVGEINQVISKMLRVPMTDSKDLSEALFRQTDGNLLFLIELVKMFLENNIVRQENGQWTWDMEKVLASVRLSSVNRLIEKKVQRLNTKEQELLRIASCLGSTFSTSTLSYAGVVTVDEVLDFAQTMEKVGLINFDSNSSTCRFAHDKVQQTIYWLTPVSVRDELHLNIGRELRKSMPQDLLVENVILVSHQISQGIHLIHECSEKLEVSELFFLAGQKAALSSSFKTAASFLNLAIHLLERRHWRDDYNRSLRLYNFASELEYYNGNLERFDELVDAIIIHARCYDDTLLARFTKIYALGSRGCMLEGIRESLEVLKCLGEVLPSKPEILQVVVGLIGCKRILYGKTDEYITNLSIMTDKRKEAAMRLLIYCIVFAFFSAGKHLPIIAFRLVKITMQNGMTEMACVGFGCLGMIYAYQGNVDEACRYSHLSLRLLEERGAKEWQARVYGFAYGLVFPLKYPYRDTVEPLRTAHRSSLVLGDIHFSMLCNSMYATRCYFAGNPLARVMKETKRCRMLCIKFGQRSVQSLVEVNLQLVLNLMGRSSNPLILTGEVINEDEAAQMARDKTPGIYLYMLFAKLQLAVYLNDFLEARAILVRLKGLDQKKILPFMIAVLHFFEGLTYAISPVRGHLRCARKQLAKLKVFAKHGPCNFLSKVHLIEAEIAAQAGRSDDATVSFNLSIDSARREGLVQDQALACERAAYALARFEQVQESNRYLVEARRLCGSWGAEAKLEAMNHI